MNGDTQGCQNQKMNCMAVEMDGTAAILVHGIPSSLNEWGRLYSDLISNGFRPMSLDLLGHGDSCKPESCDDYTSENAYAFFDDWMKSLKLDAPIVLIGHSFGGYLSIKYALENPGKVKALILIDPLLGFDQLSRGYRLALSVPALLAFLMKSIPCWLVKAFGWAANLTIDESGVHSTLSAEEINGMAKDYKKCSPNIVYLPLSASDQSHHYADLKMPTLLIWGSKDHVISVSGYKRLINECPDLKFHIINAGHYPHRTHYEEVTPIMMDFLNTKSILDVDPLFAEQSSVTHHQ